MRTAVAAAVLAALIGASAGWAGEVYRWTDAQGVVHFADVPPADQHQVETRTMPEAPARAVAEPAPGAAAVAATDPASQGAARVVLTGHEEEPLGGTRLGISGTVENKGSAPARDVAVVVKVTSPAQGDDCLTEQIEASPSTLAPGEKATFAADLDHPCFRGPTQVDVQVQWE